MNKEWIIKDDVFVGVNLGSDFCAEHEWGISKTRDYFDIPNQIRGKSLFKKPIIGIKARQIRKIPETGFIKKEYKGFLCIGFHDNSNSIYIESLIKDATKRIKDGSYNFSSYWSDGSFLLVMSDKNRAYYEDLVRAFDNLDISIMTAGRQAFSNGGLNLIITSRFPDDYNKDMERSDLSAIKLKAAADKINIEEEVRKGGKKFFALSPRWKTSGENEVVYWLNPHDQDIYNYGLFTIDEIRQWINNEGPIMKKQKPVISHPSL